MKETNQVPVVLIVDDDAGVAHLIEKALRRDGVSTALAFSGEQAIAWLEGHRADLMLLDLKLSDLHGKEVLDRLESVTCAVPFIIMTGNGDERVAVDMMKRGALDYLIKDNRFLEFVPVVVRRALVQLEREKNLVAAEVERKRLEQEILAAGENEMRKIGQDLHDGLYQILAAIAILAEVHRERLAQSSADDAGVASLLSEYARQAIELARRIARGLSMVDVEANGLMHAVQEMVDHTATLMKVACVFHCDEPVLIHDRTKATHLYRIAQEAINNAIKHGKARRIDVVLSNRKGIVELKVTDDGVGFPPEPKICGGMGLRNLNYRAGAIGARLEIRSARPQGTEVVCTFGQD